MSRYEPDEELPSWESLADRAGKLEITMAAIGRQVERITEHLGLVTDEEGDPVEIEPFAPPQYPYWPPAPPSPMLDQYMLAWLSRIRDITRDSLLGDTHAGRLIRELLYPQHIHDDDGAVEGCPGCFPPGDVIPRTAMPPASPRCAPGCGHEARP